MKMKRMLGGCGQAGRMPFCRPGCRSCSSSPSSGLSPRPINRSYFLFAAVPHTYTGSCPPPSHPTHTQQQLNLLLSQAVVSTIHDSPLSCSTRFSAATAHMSLSSSAQPSSRPLAGGARPCTSNVKPLMLVAENWSE